MCVATFALCCVRLYHSAPGASLNSHSLCHLLQPLPRKSYNLKMSLLCSPGRTSPKHESLTKSAPLEKPVQAPASAAPAPTAPVGQRSQSGAAAPRPPGTTAGSQMPPDLLEQRKGKDNYWTRSS